MISGLSSTAQLQVRNLSIAYLDDSRIDIIWEAPPPGSDGTKTEILRYSVGCVTCNNNVTFLPSRSMLSDTRLVDLNCWKYGEFGL